MWPGRIILYHTYTVYNHIRCDLSVVLCSSHKMKSMHGNLAVLQLVCTLLLWFLHTFLDQQPQPQSLAQTKLSKPIACSGTSNRASHPLPTSVTLLQLSATATKITQQRKPAPALSESSCNCSTNIYIFSSLQLMKYGLHEWVQCKIIPQSMTTQYEA